LRIPAAAARGRPLANELDLTFWRSFAERRINTGEPSSTQTKGRVTPAVIFGELQGPGQFPCCSAHANVWTCATAGRGEPACRAELPEVWQACGPELALR